jgi:hypothetical protein
MVAVSLMAIIAAFSSESQAQNKQSMKVKLNVSPSVSVGGMEAGAQRAFANEIPQLTQMFRGRAGGANSVRFGSGFALSAYENVSVLLSFTAPARARKSSNDADAARITCGYLNDGTTYFRRATITNKRAIQFQLMNNSLLKRSMKLNNPLFVAYVFFLITEPKEEKSNASPLPVSTVTVEFM